jgi:ABC-type multidrug transport system ATPase subunit
MARVKNVIEAKNLCKVFKGKTILDHLSFTWDAGAYCLYGKNGRGKSTLLRILAGAERDFSGSLHILGNDSVRNPETANLMRSFLPDHPSFYPKGTTRDLLSFVASVRKIRPSKEDPFDLGELLSKPLDQQSLGQRKRSFFGAVLLPSVPLWILDEPTNGLDSHYQTIFFDHVQSHTRSGGTVVIATHDSAVASTLSAKSLRLFPESHLKPVTDLQ